MILYLRRFTGDFACSCFWKDVEATFFRFLGGIGGPLFPGRIVLLAPNLARPRPAAPPGAPTRPACGMPGLWIRQVFFKCFMQGLSENKNKKCRSSRQHQKTQFGRTPSRKQGINCLSFTTFLFQALRCTCRVQNPNMQRAGRVGTAQGGRRGRATLGGTRCRHFGRLGSQQPLWPSSAL